MQVGAGARFGPRRKQQRLTRLTAMSCEVLTHTRGHFLPDPSQDPVVCVVWVVADSVSTAESGERDGEGEG